MPFTKIKKGKNRGKYRSPSGRIYTGKQVRLYYSYDGFPATKAQKRQYAKRKKKRKKKK